MKYIPNSAKLIIGPVVVNDKRNCYEVSVTCDANDGDYMDETFEYTELNELRILLLNYFNGSTGKWNKESDYHYGEYVADNDELRGWALNEGWLIFAGMCDDVCHSICGIECVYYDEEGKAHKVTTPNVDELFDTEEEFLEYIYKLINEEGY